MKIELVVAVISGLVAIASAIVAYMAQSSAAKSQSEIAVMQLQHNRRMSGRSRSLKPK